MSHKGKIESPPELAGFIYFYTATTICSILPKDTPAKHITDNEPSGKHKLKQGGYKCTSSKFCVQAYCFDCVVNHLGQDGRPTLQEYHGAICKANTGPVNPSLKRRIEDRSPQTPQTRTKRQRTDSNLSSTSSSFVMDEKHSSSAAGSASKPKEESSPSDLPKQRPSRSAGKKGNTKAESEGVKTPSDTEDELPPRRRRKPKVISDSDEESESKVLGTSTTTSSKAPAKASLKNLPKPPIPPMTTSSDPRDLPGASWPSTNFISRAPDPNRSREPETYQPTNEVYRRVPTNADFFTREPDGEGSWRFPDDPFFNTQAAREDATDNAANESREPGDEQEKSDATERQEFCVRMARIAEISEPWKEGKTWHQDKRSRDAFKKAQVKIKEQRKEWEKDNRFQQPLTNAERHQLSIAKRGLSVTAADEDDETNYVDIPIAAAQASARVHNAQKAALASLARTDDIPYAEPDSLNAYYPELYRPTEAAHPATTARAQQKQRLAKRDNPASLDENVLRKLRTANESATTPSALRAAIDMTEALMPMLLTETVRPEFERYLEELRERLTMAESLSLGPRAPETPPRTLRRRGSTPVSPRTKRARFLEEDSEE